LININYIHKYCELGIVIGEENCRGKGYCEEAIKLIINYAFSHLNMNKIGVEEVVEFNKGPLKLCKKIGFIKEGILKKHYYIESKYYDIYYQNLNSAFKP